MQRRIYVLGLGMVGCHQLTDEVRVALKKSQSIFLLHPDDVVVSALREKFGNVTDLSKDYAEGRSRIRTYQIITDKLLEASKNTDGPVALGVYGHPRVGVTPTALLQEQSSAQCKIDIRPGISAVDCLYNELNLDPFKTGLQMFRANDLLVRELTVNPELPAFIFQISSVESKLYSTKPSAPRRFRKIKKYLLRFYPETHEAILVKVSDHPFEPTERLPFKLKDFERMAEDILPAHTLYIPPSMSRTVQNKQLNNKLNSADHLELITKDNQDE